MSLLKIVYFFDEDTYLKNWEIHLKSLVDTETEEQNSLPVVAAAAF